MNPATEHERGEAASNDELPRRFRRSSSGQIGGVAKGMADYVGINPLFFRVGFVVLAFASGLGVFAYIGAWLLIPDERDTDERSLALTADVPALVVGFAVLAIGSIALTAGIDLDFSVWFPLSMVALGFWVLNQRRDPESSTIAFAGPPPAMMPAPPADPHVVPPPPATPPPPIANTPPPVVPGPTVVLASSPGLVDDVEPGDGDGSDDLAFDLSSDDAPTAPLGSMASSEPASPESAPWTALGDNPTGPTTRSPTMPGLPPNDAGPPAPPTSGWGHVHADGPGPRYQPAAPPQGPPIVSITMAAAVVAIGALMVVRNLGGVDVDAALFLGALLSVLGIGLVVSAFTRRALVLYPMALVVSLLVLASPLIDATARGGVGARNITATVGDLERAYDLGAGELLIDFRDLELTEDTRVEVNVGAGLTEIRLPDDLPVRVEATNRFGYVEVLGVTEEGVGNKAIVVGEPDDPQPATLTLVPTVTFGYVEVSRG